MYTMPFEGTTWWERTSANSIPCGSRYRHIPWRWLSRKSSSRRNLTAQSERQSLQYTEISSSRDCTPTATNRWETHWLRCIKATLSQQHVCHSKGRDVCLYPVQFQCKLLVPCLVADRPPARLSNYCVVQLQHCADLIWGKALSY